jgi:hypothetical protein
MHSVIPCNYNNQIIEDVSQVDQMNRTANEVDRWWLAMTNNRLD